MSIETFNDLNNNLRATNIVNSLTLFTVSYHACLPGSFRGLLCEKSDERTSAKPILWRCTLTQWNHLCVTQFTAFPGKTRCCDENRKFLRATTVHNNVNYKNSSMYESSKHLDVSTCSGTCTETPVV